MPKGKKLLIFLLLFVFYFINGIISISQLSITSDEGAHYNYAIRVVKGHPEKVRPYSDASTMPFTSLNVIPRIIEQLLNGELEKNDNGVSDIFNGRYVTLIISALIGLFLFIWSRELYGEHAGLAALALFVFCPNINAHAALVTTDAYSALFTIATAFYFWKFYKTKTWKHLFLFAISLGIAQISKQSLTHLLIIYALLAIIIEVKQNSWNRHIKWKTLRLVSILAICLFIINAGFSFQNTGRSLDQYHFKSKFFRSLPTALPVAAAIPLPFPEPYISGLDLTKHMDEIGPGHKETSGAISILGQQRKDRGFWYYYIVSFLFKTPIPTLLALGFLLFWYSKHKIKEFFQNEFIPVFILLYLIIYFSFFYNSQVGIRHIIMFYPLLYLLLSNLANIIFKKKILILGMIYTIISFYYFFPNLISYTNELVQPKHQAYKIVGSANLDLSQGYFWAKDYLKSNPKTRYVPRQASAGEFIMTVEKYTDPYDTNEYKWIKSFQPYGHIRHSILKFRISESDLKINKVNQ